MTRGKTEGAPKRASAEELAVRELSESDLYSIAFGTENDRKSFIERGGKDFFTKGQWKLNEDLLKKTARVKIQEMALTTHDARVKEFQLDEGLTDKDHSRSVSSLNPKTLDNALAYPGTYVHRITSLATSNLGIPFVRLAKFARPLPKEASLESEHAFRSVVAAFAARLFAARVAEVSPEAAALIAKPATSMQILGILAKSGYLSTQHLEYAAVRASHRALKPEEKIAITQDTEGTGASLAFARAAFRDSRRFLTLDPKKVSAEMKTVLEQQEKEKIQAP